MPKKVLIALPPAMLEQVDFIAKCEHRTRSDLIREALRRYLENFRRNQSVRVDLDERGTIRSFPDRGNDREQDSTVVNISAELPAASAR